MKTVLKPLKGIEVRTGIPGKGRGVFATQSFGVDELIELSPVILLNADDATMVQMTNLSNYTFAVDDNQSAIALGYASLYNHSKNPNAEFAVAGNAIVIKSLRKIKKDQEITLDYGWNAASLKAAGIK